MKLKILVVDDEEATRKLLSTSFKDEGCEVREASGGYQAIAMIKEEKPDKVLLDMNMEDLDGIEVLKRIKEINPGIEVIMVTGLEDMAKMNEAKRLGASHYINKPLILRELHKIVKGT